MKAWPTVLLIAAGLLLLWISSLRPDSLTDGASGTPIEEGSAYGGAGSDATVDPAGTQTPDASTPGGGETPAPPTAPAPPPPTGPGTTAAQAAEPKVPTPANPAEGQITGVVTAGDLGAAQVRVELKNPRGDLVHSTMTDALGGFQFSSLESPATYTVSAVDPNFLYTASTREMVRLGRGGAQVKVKLVRGDCIIEGNLSTAGGMAMSEHAVIVTSSTGIELTVDTNIQGNFRIGGLPAGEWTIQADDSASMASVTLQKGDVAFVEMPAVFQPAQLALTFVAGEFFHTYRFRGKDVATLTPAEGEGESLTTLIDEEGKASFENLAPGVYSLRANKGSESLLGGPDDAAVEIILAENDSVHKVVTLNKALRGTGVKVPLGIKVLLFILFGLLFVVPPLVFPPPFQAKRPDAAA